MLVAIHEYLFDEIYEFAGEVRTINMAKVNFRFALVMYLQVVLKRLRICRSQHLKKLLKNMCR